MPLFTKFTRDSSPAADGQQSKQSEAGLDLSRKSSASSMRSGSTCPPSYSDAVNSSTTAGFTPTTNLQIHARGVSSSSSLSCQDIVPIPVSRVHPGSPSSAADSTAPEYISLRIKRNSNSCALVSGSDPNRTPLNATIYRWGPGRHPRIRIMPPHCSVSVEEAIGAENVECDQVEVKSRSIISRTQRIITPFGTFQWRYGSRSERKEAFGVNSLLILEKIDDGANIRVAQFLRSEEFRTPGTSRFMAGNGGRLMVDLRAWADEKEANAAKVEAFVVASCICMLKKEIDRMRDNTLAAIV